MSNVRIKDLATDSALAAGDYIIVDSEAEGTRKYDIGSGLAGKVNKPAGNGTSGQVLKTNGDGTTRWENESGGGGGGASSSDDVSNASSVTGTTVTDALNYLQTNKAGKSNATTSAAGLMSATDKSHLDAVYADYSSAIAALGVS